MEFFNSHSPYHSCTATKNGFPRAHLRYDFNNQCNVAAEARHNSGGRWTVRTGKMRVGLWVIGAFLAYLLVFLLWFPLWQHSPHSFSARVLGFLFGALMAILVAIRSRRGFSRRWDWACYRDRNQSIRVN